MVNVAWTSWTYSRYYHNSITIGLSMRGRRTHLSNKVYSLPGGTEDNDLWIYDDGEHLRSCWVPSDEERAAIAAGENIELIVWGRGHPT
jgi:hypothetical protein